MQNLKKVIIIVKRGAKFTSHVYIMLWKSSCLLLWRSRTAPYCWTVCGHTIFITILTTPSDACRLHYAQSCVCVLDASCTIQVFSSVIYPPPAYCWVRSVRAITSVLQQYDERCAKSQYKTHAINPSATPPVLSIRLGRSRVPHSTF